MKITVLIENSKPEDSVLTAEHGLSFLIEFEGKRYLLDAGSTSAVIKNAEQMGIDLREVDTCLLSHGHYDHCGGFHDFFAQNQKAAFYAMDSVTESYYSGTGGMHEIGLPENLIQDIEKRLTRLTAAGKIAGHVWAVPHTAKGLEKIGAEKKLYRKHGTAYEPDDFAHEVSYVFEIEKGLVIINSCSHGGISNILKEVTERFPQGKIYAFLGGMHMKGKKDGREICTFSDAEIEAVCAEMMEREIQKIYTGHCTGSEGYRQMKVHLGDRLYPLTTGMQIVL